MSETLIKVNGISKKFCRSLKKSLWYGMKDLGREITGRHHVGEGELRPDEFWAVKDVSFELKRGECLGLIGRNGAGKTTLLKILNGLIRPDSGRVEMQGRIGALIALGAGFNPILSGRENIYINASILGLSKREIDEKIDEIIDFSEIRDFIDMPVQNYSSGMSVRLGFSIATTLNSDILILDEILAVGDAAFRAKCYRKLSESMDNSAVILVSHSMEQIGQVCSRVILMNYGEKIFDGHVNDGIVAYTNKNIPSKSERNKIVELAECISISQDIQYSRIIGHGDIMKVKLRLLFKREIISPDVKVTIFDLNGSVVAEAYSKHNNHHQYILNGTIDINANIGPLHLKSGNYSASIAILERKNNNHLYWGVHVVEFKANGPEFGASVTIPPINIEYKEVFDSVLTR